MDIRKEQEREYLLNKIKNKCNRKTTAQAEAEINRIIKEQEDEDKKMIFYMKEKSRIQDEKEFNEKIRRQKDGADLRDLLVAGNRDLSRLQLLHQSLGPQLDHLAGGRRRLRGHLRHPARHETERLGCG